MEQMVGTPDAIYYKYPHAYLLRSDMGYGQGCSNGGRPRSAVTSTQPDRPALKRNIGFADRD